jgi:hypothetical protein
LNQDEWYEGLEKWLRENAVKDKDGWKCKKCGVYLMGRGKIVSLHLKGTLAGFGETVELIEPYCPKCGICYEAPRFLDHGGIRDIF